MSRHDRADGYDLPEVSRRGALRALAGGAAALGGAKAVDNVLVGYGTLTGTNLVDQDLAALVAADLGPPDGFEATADGHAVSTADGRVDVVAGDDLLLRERLDALAAETVSDLGLPGELSALLADLAALARGDVGFEFSGTEAFFERVASAEARPAAVEALRRWPTADPDLVAAFAGADPAQPAALIEGLVEGFREHTYYDVPRYLAGSVQDNVIMAAADLRASFREPVGFPAIVDGPETGLFCWEFTDRSLEALHAVPAAEQSVPVAAASVVDDRHKHVYTGVLSLVRDGGDLRAPMTFVDYTHTTLYDDLNLRGVMGEGLEAYNRRHRATAVNWDPYA